MSGDLEIFACDAAGLSEEGPRKRSQCEVDHFLLTHQFVTSKRHPERLWRVQKGSGTGTKNSGEVSDAACAFLVERCLKPDTLSTFSIDLYGRFEGDIIIVAKNRALTKHFVWRMKHRSRYYKSKWRKSLTYQSSFWKSECGKMVLVSSQALSSSHQVCGNHWERTVLMLLTATHRGPLRASPCMSRALSGTPAIFQKAKQELINRFISHFAPESIIDNLRQIDGLAAIRRGSQFHGMWLVVGFHPVDYRALRRAMVRFQASKEMQERHEWAFDAKCPKKTICVGKRHAAPQVHHPQDVQADRKLRRIWKNSK